MLPIRDIYNLNIIYYGPLNQIQRTPYILVLLFELSWTIMNQTSVFNQSRFLMKTSYVKLIVATFFIITIGSVVYHFLEGWNWIDSIYFSVITLTTVGYGDFSPQTDLGKIFTVIYLLTGMGIIFGFINAFYLRRVETERKFLSKNKKDKRATN